MKPSGLTETGAMMPKDHGLEVTANNTRIVTVWDEKYCTSAAPTNSTRKQAEVVKMALPRGCWSLEPFPSTPNAPGRTLPRCMLPPMSRP